MSLLRYQTPDLSKWSAFDRLATLRSERDRVFDFARPSRGQNLFNGWSPALDVSADENTYVVTVELPGVNKDQIAISLENGVLTISGERKNENEASEGQTFRSERYFGKFQRSVTLPVAVDAGKVKASYTDGVLSVELPKAEEAKPRRIAISVS